MNHGLKIDLTFLSSPSYLLQLPVNCQLLTFTHCPTTLNFETQLAVSTHVHFIIHLHQQE